MGPDPGGIRSGWEQGTDGAKVRAGPNRSVRTCHYAAGGNRGLYTNAWSLKDITKQSSSTYISRSGQVQGKSRLRRQQCMLLLGPYIPVDEGLGNGTMTVTQLYVQVLLLNN